MNSIGLPFQNSHSNEIPHIRLQQTSKLFELERSWLTNYIGGSIENPHSGETQIETGN